jgi:hypothetical protein
MKRTLDLGRIHSEISPGHLASSKGGVIILSFLASEEVPGDGL